jgi:succinyl-diaminopimelate desuccinylase
MITLGEYFISNNIKPSKNIRLIFTADEEASGIGITSVLETRYLDDVDFIIVPENTSSNVVLKEKGALWLSLELFGKSAHGARPDLGINSVEIMYELVNDLKSYVEGYCNDDLLGDSTVSLNCISGGEKVNIIADYCKAEIDIRANPDLNNDEIIEYLERQITKYENRYKGLKVKYNVLTDRPSLEMDSNNKYVKEFVRALESLNMEYEYAGVTYFTDLSLTVLKVEKPFIIFGPGFIDKGHQVDECASIDAIEKASELFIKYLK